MTVGISERMAELLCFNGLLVNESSVSIFKVVEMWKLLKEDTTMMHTYLEVTDISNSEGEAHVSMAVLTAATHQLQVSFQAIKCAFKRNRRRCEACFSNSLPQ
jgi:hypothetical protein